MSKLSGLKAFMKDVHKLAKKKGWYDKEVIKTDLEHHMLIVSEIAEATEEVRKGSPVIYDSLVVTAVDQSLGQVSTKGKPEGEVVELADALIRILDYCEYKKLPLIKAIEMKHEYNKTRPYRHGGKLK